MPDAQPVTRPTILRPSARRPPLDLRELAEYRELLSFLVWRDLKVRYAQTALGAAWAIFQPLLTMVVFTVFLGRLAGVPSDDVPYPLFSLTALVPWTYFATALVQGANSLSGNASLIDKVYFPRLLLPLSTSLAALVDFLLAFGVLLVLLLFFGRGLSSDIVALPLFVALLLTTTLGAVFWAAALNARYRDVRHAIPLLVQLLLLVSPVAYPSRLVPDAWRTVYALNPMVSVIDGFRWSLLGSGELLAPPLLASVLVALLLLVSGAYYLRGTERTFADVL